MSGSRRCVWLHCAMGMNARRVAVVLLLSAWCLWNVLYFALAPPHVDKRRTRSPTRMPTPRPPSPSPSPFVTPWIMQMHQMRMRNMTVARRQAFYNATARLVPAPTQRSVAERFPLPRLDLVMERRDGSCLLASALDCEHAITHPGGSQYNPDDGLARDVVASVMHRCIQPAWLTWECVAMDVGSHIGATTLAMLHHQARVISIEADVELCAATHISASVVGYRALHLPVCLSPGGSAAAAAARVVAALAPARRRMVLLNVAATEDACAVVEAALDAGAKPASIHFAMCDPPYRAGRLLHRLSQLGYTILRVGGGGDVPRWFVRMPHPDARMLVDVWRAATRSNEAAWVLLAEAAAPHAWRMLASFDFKP